MRMNPYIRKRWLEEKRKARQGLAMIRKLNAQQISFKSWFDLSSILFKAHGMADSSQAEIVGTAVVEHLGNGVVRLDINAHILSLLEVESKKQYQEAKQTPLQTTPLKSGQTTISTSTPKVEYEVKDEDIPF